MKVYGPYIKKSESGRGTGRKYVVLAYPDGRKKSTAYARYLMEQHLGRELSPDETVDHIDGDPTNDSLDNLQILSLADNIRKSHRKPEWYVFDCPVCGVETKKRAAQVRHNKKQGKAGPYCSRECARAAQLS